MKKSSDYMKQHELTKTKRQKQEIIAVYDYIDLDGCVLHQTVRFAGKKFLQRRPDGNGGWIWNLNGVSHILYKLAQVVKANNITLCEGEKDCDSVIKHFGLTATTNPMGAGKWRKHYNEHLKGKTILIVPDNDNDPGSPSYMKGIEHAVDIANQLLGIAETIKIVELPEELNGHKIKDITDFIEAGGTKKAFLKLADEVKEHEMETHLPEASKFFPVINTEDAELDNEDQITQCEKLLMLAAPLVLFHDQNKDAFVFLENEAIPLRNKRVKQWLSYEFYKAEGKASNSDAMNQTIVVLEGKAIFACDQIELFNRIAKRENAFWYDLGNGKAVKITSEGWCVVDVPILFRRYSHQQPQLMPTTEGGPSRIFEYLNIDDKHQLLIMVVLISCFIPDIPHPIFHPHGPQGAGKTTLCRIIKMICDPSSLETLIPPKDLAQLVQVIAHHHVCVFDNMSGLPQWMSDILAQACTGGGFSKRRLFTDDDDVIYQVKRCIGINGINLLISKPDLMDRTILLHLERINPDTRIDEKKLWENFRKDIPGILGGIFNVLVKAMRIYPDVTIDKLPRMADFAKWGYAIAEALGRCGSDFLVAYQCNVERQNEEVIQGSTLAQAVLIFMADRDRWEGTVKEAYEGLSQLVQVTKEDKTFPKHCNKLRKALERIKANLLDLGITFSIADFNNVNGVPMSFQKVSKSPSAPSVSSKPSNNSNLPSEDTVELSSSCKPLDNKTVKHHEDTEDEIEPPWKAGNNETAQEEEAAFIDLSTEEVEIIE
jgi:hypothetical protein